MKYFVGNLSTKIVVDNLSTTTNIIYLRKSS